MVGCYGYSKEDRYFEQKLNDYLNEQDNTISGEFNDYEVEIEYEHDHVIFLVLSGRIDHSSLDYVKVEGARMVSRNDDEQELTAQEVESMIDIEYLVIEQMDKIIEYIVD